MRGFGLTELITNAMPPRSITNDTKHYLGACVASLEKDEPLLRNCTGLAQLIVLLFRKTFRHICEQRTLFWEAPLVDFAARSIEFGHYVHKELAVDPLQTIGVLYLGVGYIDIVGGR